MMRKGEGALGPLPLKIPEGDDPYNASICSVASNSRGMPFSKPGGGPICARASVPPGLGCPSDPVAGGGVVGSTPWQGNIVFSTHIGSITVRDFTFTRCGAVGESRKCD